MKFWLSVIMVGLIAVMSGCGQKGIGDKHKSLLTIPDIKSVTGIKKNIVSRADLHPQGIHCKVTYSIRDSRDYLLQVNFYKVEDWKADVTAQLERLKTVEGYKGGRHVRTEKLSYFGREGYRFFGAESNHLFFYPKNADIRVELISYSKEKTKKNKKVVPIRMGDLESLAGILIKKL